MKERKHVEKIMNSTFFTTTFPIKIFLFFIFLSYGRVFLNFLKPGVENVFKSMLKKQARGWQGLAPVSGASASRAKRRQSRWDILTQPCLRTLLLLQWDSYNCRLFTQEVLSPSKSRQTLSTPGLFLATLFLW